MQQVSQEYKDYLKQPFLDTSWTSSIILGAINQQAQSSSYVFMDKNLTDYSSGYIFEDNQESTKYASYERNRSRVNGSFSFLPFSAYDWTGLTSLQVSDENGNINCIITLRQDTGVPILIKGITIIFPEDIYPTMFDILDKEGNVLLSVSDHSGPMFQSDFVYEFESVILLHIKRLSKPHYRFRLLNITFGLSLRFDSNQIISMTYKEQLQLISTEMYMADLSITLDNQDLRYDIENPSSEVNFLEQSQKLEAYLSLPLPSGAIEKIKIGTMYLSEWSAKLDTATFKATDRFNFMDGLYTKGSYHQEGISLYELAKNVLQDAGIEVDDYVLDVYLKTIKIYNPIPVCSHKEALKMIANAGRCVLKQDRDGRIMMKSSFVPDTEVTSQNKVPYAKMEAVVGGRKKEAYATYEKDLNHADGTRYFAPSNKPYLLIGYMSESLSDVNCMYGSKPHILIDFEASANLFGTNILFGATTASDFVITTYLDDTQVETLVFTGNTVDNVCINHPFLECNRMLITFTKSTNPLQRVYVDGITFDTVTDKYFGLGDISQGTLEGTKQESVKQLNVIRTVYTPAQEEETADVRITKVAGDETATKIDFSDPMHTARLMLLGKDISEGHTAWCGVASLPVPNTGSIEYVIQLVGRKLNKVTQTLIFPINPTGCVKTVENTLISDPILASDTGEWISSYLKADREYSYGYAHGDPSLDTNDIIHQENKYVDDLLTQVYSHELNIAGAVTGKIKARRAER